MSFKAYEEFKDSNIDWIGPIPNYWQSYKLKHVINEFIAGGTPKSSNDAFWDENNNGIPWIAIGDMTDNDYVNSTVKSITREGLADKNLRILKKGTLIYSIFASLGKTAILNIDATTNQAILGLITSTKIDVKYLKYYLEALKGTISRFSNENTQENLNSNIVKNMEIAMPESLEEQKQIVNYLDKQTAKIDATIAKNKELIELLEEKRVALINQVVTKGLNPDVPMKYSGVEWIGKIPEHWNIMKLKHHGFVLGGYAFKSGDFTDSGVKVVKITNVQSLKFDWSECFYLPKSYLHEHSEFKINKGDIIFALTRPIISTGIKAAIFDENEPALANQRTGIFKKHSNDLISTFLYYVIYSDYFKEDFKSKITATNQPNISPLDIGEIKLILPSVEEQKQIVSKLDEETKKISEVISKIKENINLLEEYKTSLIHNVVTGKIDVREEVI